MRQRQWKLIMSGLAVMVITVLFSAQAAAHVVVKPGEVPTAAFQSFVVGVPNEKDLPVTGLKLEIPAGLQFVSPTVKPGWNITTEKTGQGEDAIVTSITWTEGAIAVDLRDDFSFSAKTPAKPGELHWRAYQTYADGQVVSWDVDSAQAGDHESAAAGPFSVTKVVNTAAPVTNAQVDDAKHAASRAQTLGIVGIVLGIIAISRAARKPGVKSSK